MRQKDSLSIANGLVKDLPLTTEEMGYIVKNSSWEDICYNYTTNIDNEDTRRFHIRRVYFELLLAERCIATGEEPWLLLPKDMVDESLSSRVMERLLFYIKEVEDRALKYYKEYRVGKYIPREYFTLIRKAVQKGVDIEKEPERLRNVLFNDKNTRSFLNEKYTINAFQYSGRGNIKSMLLRRQIEHTVISNVIELELNIKVTNEEIFKARIRDIGTKVTGGHTKYGHIGLDTFYKIRKEAIGGKMKHYFDAKLQKAYCLLKNNMDVFRVFMHDYPSVIEEGFGRVRIRNGEFVKNQPAIFLYLFSKVCQGNQSAIRMLAQELSTSSEYEFTDFGKALVTSVLNS